MSVKVEFIEKGGFVKKQMAFVKILSDKHLQAIAEETEKRLQFNVTASIQRPESTGNLAEQMTKEKIPGGWGVGNISKLNQRSPQWLWVNSGRAGTGRTIPPGTAENPKIKGSFSPGQSRPNSGSFRGGRFQKGGGFHMNPTKPITPHLFIEKTIQQIPTLIKFVLGKVK